jgi:hypothetical protein
VPTPIGVSWIPAFHARQAPAPAVHSASISATKRDALNKLLGANPAESRVDRSFARGGIAPSRWTDGSFGAFYVAESPTTTQLEMMHHLRNAYTARGFATAVLTLQVVHVDVRGIFDDVRAEMAADPLLQSDDYAASQAFAKERHAVKSRGFVYESVRDPGHLCAAVVDRAALTNPRLGESVSYQWNGTEFV